jgi:hypothetical protein
MLDIGGHSDGSAASPECDDRVLRYLKEGAVLRQPREEYRFIVVDESLDRRQVLALHQQRRVGLRDQ